MACGVPAISDPGLLFLRNATSNNFRRIKIRIRGHRGHAHKRREEENSTHPEISV